MNERTKLIDKISKIKRKADGTDSPEEAEAFLRKMQKLLNEHGLTEADLTEEPLEMKIGYGVFDITYNDPWRESLIIYCVEFCGCFAVGVATSTGQKTSKFLIYGRQPNILSAIEIYGHVHSQIKTLARRIFPEDRTKYRRAQEGIAVGVMQKIDAIMQNVKEEGVDTSVPMIVEAKVVEDFVRSSLDLKSVAVNMRDFTAETYVGFLASDMVDIRSPLATQEKK